MFSADNAVATVKRHGYSGGKSTAPVATGTTYKGYLTPESENSAFITADTLGEVYRFSTQYGADIQKADIITIASDTLAENGKEFSVKAVLHKHGCTLAFTRAWLVLKENGN